VGIYSGAAVQRHYAIEGGRRARGGGNRTRVHSNEIRYLQTKQVPQECLSDFRLLLERQPRASAWLQAESTRFGVTLIPAPAPAPGLDHHRTWIVWAIGGHRLELRPPPITRKGPYN
jgi:hypothetical protein